MITELTPVFVDNIPEVVEEGIIYITEKYETSVHLCACGCGEKTVCPLGKGEWSITKNSDGTITLNPSIGNWAGQKVYHNHYFIRNNKIVQA